MLISPPPVGLCKLSFKFKKMLNARVFIESLFQSFLSLSLDGQIILQQILSHVGVGLILLDNFYMWYTI